MEPSVGSAFSPPPPSFPSELPPIPGVSTSSSLQLTGDTVLQSRERMRPPLLLASPAVHLLLAKVFAATSAPS